MTGKETEVQRYDRLLRVAADHAVQYKALCHSLQDDFQKATDLAIAQRKKIEDLRKRIAYLENKCGEDEQL